MPLEPRQLELLTAAIDAIIPSDDYPSASQAGVLDYITRQLAGDLADFEPELAKWLDCLDLECGSVFAQDFLSLHPGARDELLDRIEMQNTRCEWPMDPLATLNRLIEITAEGYYGDPGNGGNLEGASWKMIGFHPDGEP